MVSNDIGGKLAKLLGLPEDVRWFEIRVAAGELVKVKCEYIQQRFEIGENSDFVTELAEYELVKREIPEPFFADGLRKNEHT